MIAGVEITLLRPFWLLALPVLAGYAWWLYTKPGGLGDWDRVVNPALLAAMTALGRVDGHSSRLPLAATLLVAVIAVLALAGPAVERREALSYRNLDGVVFVVDASRSVTEGADWPQVLTIGRYGLASLGTRPGGLVVYAGDAYVATDMTADLLQLGQTFSLIDPQTVPDPGTRPERGLALATTMLQEAEVIAGDVILFTDGAGFGPDTAQEAGRIADQGARLSIVSLTEATPTMHSIAAIGGGRLFSLDQANALASWLKDDGRRQLARQDYPLLFWKDLGRYLLALALIPLLVVFRRSAI